MAEVKMFTGIIEEIGRLAYIKRQGQTLHMTIHSQIVVADSKLGDSIAVNGVCLTVTRINSSSFTVDVMPVTYQATNLAQLSCGDLVNLERAMAANGRFGGHMVSGHIDGSGIIAQIIRQENALVYKIKLAPQLASMCIAKGSIAIDGTSLTLVAVSSDWVTVALIPHTQKMSLLGQKKVGALVNIECDILAKQLQHAKAQDIPEQKLTLTYGFLHEHGYI